MRPLSEMTLRELVEIVRPEIYLKHAEAMAALAELERRMSKPAEDLVGRRVRIKGQEHACVISGVQSTVYELKHPSGAFQTCRRDDFEPLEDTYG